MKVQLLTTLVLLIVSAPALAGAPKQAGIEVSVRSSPGAACRALRSTFVVDAADGTDAMPRLRDALATQVEVPDAVCVVQASFRDEARRLDVVLGDGGRSEIAPVEASSGRARAFRPTDRSVGLRGTFGDMPWRADLSLAELTTLGAAGESPSFLDLSALQPVVVRVRRCVGAVCEAYHQVDTTSVTPTCTAGLELRLIDDTLAVTDPTVQRCLPESDGVALAVFPTRDPDRTQTLSVSVPGYDLPALLVKLPRADQQLLSVDVRVQQDP